METVLIAGGTGLVGKRLTQLLTEQGYGVILLSRSAGRNTGSSLIRYAQWDPGKGSLDEAAFAEADYVVNLAGAGVADQRWTAARKKEIRDSRVQAGETLVKALHTIPHKIKAFVNASAQGWYGPDPATHDGGFMEEDAPFTDYLARTCVDWEGSVKKVEEAGVRLVKLRIGIVLANGGGAMKEFRKPIAFRFATVLGSGKQMVSWIHVDDLCGMFLHAIQNTAVTGIYNACAPHPVSNKELIHAIANARWGNAYLSMPVPAFVLKLMMGEMSIEVLKSCTMQSAKIVLSGFRFTYPVISSAVKHLQDADK